jgi:hypothetical protein
MIHGATDLPCSIVSLKVYLTGVLHAFLGRSCHGFPHWSQQYETRKQP